MAIDYHDRGVETWRQRCPIWGKRKIAVLLRRKPGPHRLLLLCRQRRAKRLPKGIRPQQPGQLVQVDTLFVHVAPDKSVKYFTAYDPAAKWTTALVAGNVSAGRARTLLDKLITTGRFR